MIKAIIFDWDGVFQEAYGKYVPGRLAKKLNMTEEFVRSAVTGYRQEYEVGSDYSGYFEYASGKMGIPNEEIINAAKDIPFFETFSFAKKLSKKYRIYILSNQMRWRSSQIKDLNDLGFFKGVFFSNETGFTKPERNAYDDFLKRTGEKAEECLFVDDNPINTRAAESAGMKAIVFGSYGQLIDELRGYGIRE
jgi:HAD superfamily hydrolase (TIGR01549 family)